MVTAAPTSEQLPPDASISSTAALAYWSNVSSDDYGMLGSYPEVSRIDLQGSRNFLSKLKRATHIPSTRNLARVVDCGAGVGRITKGFLANVADVVDVVEPVRKFTEHILNDPSFTELREQGKIGDVFTVGLEDWDPAGKGVQYDLIWNQWCCGQLKDEQLVLYLEKCKGALSEDGWIVVKENMTTSQDDDDVYDETDSSVTRSDEKFKILFRRAGLKIISTELQRGFPKSLGLFPVRSYALRP